MESGHSTLDAHEDDAADSAINVAITLWSLRRQVGVVGTVDGVNMCL